MLRDASFVETQRDRETVRDDPARQPEVVGVTRGDERRARWRAQAVDVVGIQENAFRC